MLQRFHREKSAHLAHTEKGDEREENGGEHGQCRTEAEAEQTDDDADGAQERQAQTEDRTDRISQDYTVDISDRMYVPLPVGFTNIIVCDTDKWTTQTLMRLHKMNSVYRRCAYRHTNTQCVSCRCWRLWVLFLSMRD